MKLNHEFVEFMPDHLSNGVLYISIPYATACHRCPCGCGSEVVTPLGPTDWSLIFDGVSISLEPSVGNWSFKCQSHYWIKKNHIVFAKKWSRDEIETNRKYDRKKRKEIYKELDSSQSKLSQNPPNTGWIDRFWDIFK